MTPNSTNAMGSPQSIQKRRRWLWITAAIGVVVLILVIHSMKNSGCSAKRDSMPAWSPDGQFITFSSTRDCHYDTYMMRSDGSAVVQLTADPFLSFNFLGSPTDFWSRWSPDGTRIVFASGRDNSRMSYVDMNLYVMKSDGSNVTQLTKESSIEGQPSWSPDGSRIAFISDAEIGKGHGMDIYMMNSDGSNQTNLAHRSGNEVQPVWSPDGRRIAFVREIGGQEDIYTIDSDGNNVNRLTESGSGISSTDPAWSPDGLSIAFASNRGGDFEIYVMNADGSNPVQITKMGHNTMPTWSPDGKRIAFASSRDGYIYAMDVDGSHIAQLTGKDAR